MQKNTHRYRLLALASALGLSFVATTSFASTFASIYDFTGGQDGLDPDGLVLGSDGNLYGTSLYGGTSGYGTVFKVSPATGQLTVLHTFGTQTSDPDGIYPGGSLIQGADGNFYGITNYGGVNGGGTAFVITPGGSFTVLHSFVSDVSPLSGQGTDEQASSLTLGADGNYYGILRLGAANGYGGIFRLTSSGAYTVLYSFSTPSGSNGVNSDGRYPEKMILGSDGNMYGLAASGGTDGLGTVFKFSPSTSQFTTLHSFNGTDGAGPSALVQDGATFYGATTGDLTGGNGTLFSLTSSGAFTLLYTFTGNNEVPGPGHGLAVNGPNGLALGQDGNLYGTVQYGGTNSAGTVFKATTGGLVTTLYTFNAGAAGAGTTSFHYIANVGGSYPSGAFVGGSSGAFYGVAGRGGKDASGTVFQLTP